MKVKCTKCQKYFGVNLDSQVLVEWNEDVEFCLSIYENNLIEESRAAYASSNLKIMYA
jgi:hypothetical protein